MSKILAIKGDYERGKEVIALLEMLGGNNKRFVLKGFDVNTYYYIDRHGDIINCYTDDLKRDVFICLTLNEFNEKYPFKVGDKVFLYDNITEGCVTGMEWAEDKGTVKYCVYTSAECWCDVKELLKWNTIDKEEEMKSKREYDKLRMPLDDDDKLATEVTIMGKRILPPDGYLVGKITQTDNGMLVEYVNKKPKYPKTYVDSCEVLVGRKPKDNEISFEQMRLYLVDENNSQNFDFNAPMLHEFNCLYRLVMCKYAYWKIAGEEMGLGKPWEPDLENEELYCIQNYNKQIIKSKTNTAFNKILVFPTEKMRDAFYENFKDLIEQCKKLL